VHGVPCFPRSLQRDTYSCGARAVYTVFQHFQRALPYSEVVSRLKTDCDGTNVKPMLNLLREQGFSAGRYTRMSFEQLLRALARQSVLILDVDGGHFLVCHGVDLLAERVYVSDPSIWRTWGRTLSLARFKRRWDGSGVVVRLR
jgi:ABC-type bacteriocin/lantibiotic exporter with double-glycine peptidase domain